MGHSIVYSRRNIPGIQRQFRVQDTAFYRELFQEEFEAVRTVDIIDKDYAFALNELELEDDICKKEFVDF